MDNRKPFLVPVHETYEVYEPTVINKVALIDADRYKHLVTYRMYQKMMDEGEEHSKRLLDEIIESYLSVDIFNCFKATSYVFCFSAPSSKVFRHAIAQEKLYKGNRKRDDPYMYPSKFEDMAYVYEYIASKHFTLFDNALEADDLLSMLQDENTFIFSHDKDLKQVPGFHWDIKNSILYFISEKEANISLLSQTLTGDSTDNIAGLKGFGAKSLEKLLQETELNDELLLMRIMKLYFDKYGLRNGIDSFVESWLLLSCKFNRGEHFKEKYKEMFFLVEKLTSNINTDGVIRN